MLPKSRLLFSPRTFARVFGFVAVFLMVVVLAWWRISGVVDAQIVNFYATTCLGGWSNPDGAASKPDVESGYNEQNSAVYKDNAAAIYCGGYEGTLPPQTKHTQVALRFSWTQDQDTFVAPVVVEDAISDTESIATSSDVVATTTEGNIESTESESEEVQEVVDEGVVVEEQVEVPAEPQPAPPTTEEVAEPVPEPEPTEPTVSLLQTIFSVAHAQEATTTETVAAPDDAQFEIQYTLDGDSWKTLAYVAEVRNDVTLIFPTEAFANTEDISRVQIAVRPLLRIEKTPETYLDAMWLEVSYAPIEALGINEMIIHAPESFSFADVTFTSPSISTSSASSTATQHSSSTILATTILRVSGIDSRYILLHTKPRDEYYELWLFDLKNRTAAKIADETITIGQHFGGVKDNLIFWYSQNKDRVYVYDLRTSGTYHELWLVSNLPESEEALSFTFPFTSWRLVDGEQFFTFSSTETGEVFSDGSTESLESFLSEFNLTDYLDEEKLSEIGLSGV